MPEQEVQEYTPLKMSKTAILNQLDGYDFRLLEEIDYLSRQQAKKSPTGARYCMPSEMHLAEKVGLSRSNVSRHITKLAQLGILTVQHRKPRRDRFLTNLYKISSWVAWRFMSLIRQMRPKFKKKLTVSPPNLSSTLTPPPLHSHPVPLATQLTVSMRETLTSEAPISRNTTLNSILDRWRLRASS